MKTFSDRYLASLKPKANRYEEQEGRGFYIRVYPTGKKSFLLPLPGGKIAQASQDR